MAVLSYPVRPPCVRLRAIAWCAVLAAAALAVAACTPATPSVCTVVCGTGGTCPSAMACGDDNYCHAPGDTANCLAPDAGPGDDSGPGTGAACDDDDLCGERLVGGEVVDCGECPGDEVCGGGGPNRCGDDPCQPVTCGELGLGCGAVSDGCQGVLTCGSCAAPSSCGGAGDDGSCGCGPIPADEITSFRLGHSAVMANGSMIIWGGRFGGDYFGGGVALELDVGEWQPLPVDESTPGPRSGHSAVWTGTEMIVWGGHFGNDHYATGARYNPATGAWTPLPVDGNTPKPRAFHTAVWTGSEMIVWGGQLGQQEPLSDGAAFDPATGQWHPLPVDDRTPAARAGHSAIWTGTEMVVFGGIIGSIPGLLECGGSSIFRDGARYDPAGGVWTELLPTEDSPDFRTGHVAAWTGSHMLIWGGCNGSDYFADGWLLDPATGVWTPATSGECNPSHRGYASAVWTGSDVIIWGGAIGSDHLRDGRRFAPH